MNKAKWISSVIAVSLAISCCTIPATSFASTSRTQQKQKLSQIKENKKNTKAQLDDVQNKMDEQKSKIADLEKQVSQENDKIVSLNKKLEQNKKDLKIREANFKKYLSYSYIHGENEYLARLLEAETFSQFLNRFEIIRVMVKKDYTELKQYRDVKNALQNNLKKVEEAKAQKASLLANENKVVANLQSEYMQHKQELDQYASQEQEVLAELEKSAFNDVGQGTGRLGFPTTSGFVYWNYHQWRGNHYHEGVDFPRPSGTPIYAADAGVVTKCGPASGYGWVIVISHGNGMSTVYGHMYSSTVLVSTGERVSKGQQIAGVGNNGRSTGYHLHFEVRIHGRPTNPKNYL